MMIYATGKNSIKKLIKKHLMDLSAIQIQSLDNIKYGVEYFMGKNRKRKKPVGKSKNLNINNSSSNSSSKRIEILGLVIAVASLFVSLISMFISYNMQSEINIFTENMGKVNYELSIQQTPIVLSADTLNIDKEHESEIPDDAVFYTVTPFIITKNKDTFSGDYGKCYFATVNNQEIDIAELNDDFLFRYFNNGCLIDMLNKNSDNVFNFYYSPGPDASWSIFHIIIQGYSGEKVYYTMVCNCKNSRNTVDSELFDNENIYDTSKVESYLSRTTLDISSEDLIKLIESERNILKEKLS